MKKEIGEFIIREFEKPVLNHTTISGVEISPDFKHATVYLSTYGSKKDKNGAKNFLNKEASFIRWSITRRIRTRYIPQISFEVDESIDRGFEIDEILNEIKKVE